MNYYLIAVIAVVLSSCGVTKNTCQYFETGSTNVKEIEKVYRYEDSIVRIDYNLWEKGGKLAFTIYNKLDVPIYVNWKNSNFIFLGFSNTYWSDEVTSVSSSATIGAGASKRRYDNTTVAGFASLSNEVTTIKRENPSIQIPPRSANYIHKFDLNIPVLNVRDTTMSFDKESSPLSFRNYIAISKDKNFDEQLFIDNEFWISQFSTISNFQRTMDCNYTSSPSTFFIKSSSIVSNKERKRSPSRNRASKSPAAGLIAIGGMFGLLMIVSGISILFN